MGVGADLDLFGDPIDGAALALHVAGGRAVFIDEAQLLRPLLFKAPVGKGQVCRIVGALDLQPSLAHVEAQAVAIAGVFVGIADPRHNQRHRGGCIGPAPLADVGDMVEIVKEALAAQVEMQQFQGVEAGRGGVVLVVEVVHAEIEMIAALVGEQPGFEQRARFEAVIFERPTRLAVDAGAAITQGDFSFGVDPCGGLVGGHVRQRRAHADAAQHRPHQH